MNGRGVNADVAQRVIGLAFKSSSRLSDHFRDLSIKEGKETNTNERQDRRGEACRQQNDPSWHLDLEIECPDQVTHDEFRGLVSQGTVQIERWIYLSQNVPPRNRRRSIAIQRSSGAPGSSNLQVMTRDL